VREATGLVRDVGPWSGLAFNVIWTGNAVGLTAAFILNSFVFVSPGLNIVGLILLATVLSTLNAAVYMFFSLAMPRSGGDYQYISRTLHPALGLMSGINWALWLPLVLGWTGSQLVPIAFRSLLTGYGVATNNQGLVIQASSLFTPNNTFAIGTVFIIAFTLITLLGNRVYFGFQRVAFIFMLLAIAITIGVFVTNSPSSTASNIDKIFGAGTYQSTINSFTKNGGITPRPAITGVLSGIVLWAGINTWSMGTSLMAGEVKNARQTRTWMISNILGALVVGLLFALTTFLYLNSVGENFVYAASYLSGSPSYKLVFPPYYSSFVIIAAPNIVLFLIFAIGFYLGGMFYMPQNKILAS
jgi:amino acid transporter